MKTLIQNGRIVTATDDYTADILIDGETIVLIGKSLDVPADRTIDATGKLVIPGAIDPHTHMELPFGGTFASDDFRTGTIAAAFGGTTTIIDFAVQGKGQTLQQGLDAWHSKAAGKTAIDYGFHLICVDLEGDRMQEMAGIVAAGVTSFKLFMAYPGVFLVDDATIYKAMTAAKEVGGLIMMHAENGIVINELVKKALADGQTAPRYHALTRPPITEAEGTHRAIAISEMAGGAPLYIVHVSCAASLNEVRQARERRLPVWGETCTQYLYRDINDYDEQGFDGFAGAKYVMTPPMREKWNQEELWKGLQRGDLALVSTDHCPFFLKDQKELGRGDFTKIPNGAPGVEDRLSLLYYGGVVQGRVSLNRWVEMSSTAAAKLFGLFPKKGTIAVGSDADIVLFDPDQKRTLSAATQHMNTDYSLFEGMEIQGEVETVLMRGKVIIENGTYLGTPGEGRFLKRKTFTGM